MTWSLLARDDATGQLGVAIASRFFAVGALCVHARAGAGALATQALMNPLYGPRGIERLAAGQCAAEVIAALTGADAGRAHRQLHVLPAQGAPAAHTGEACVPWCGHLLFGDLSAAGNMLVSAEVLQASVEAFRAAQGRPLAERLLAALHAGDAAGGDKRGRQSAALRIQGAEAYPQLDLRVDDHAAPFVELQRLYEKSLERFQPFVACLARRGDPAGELDRAAIEAHIERFAAQRRASE
jgi:uncharacterized Ntn-hydrolase superfamily protein